MLNPMTAEEIVSLITATASDKNDDFRVKVMRKRHPNALPEPVAVLDDAMAEHAVNPEMWLPRLAGGGPTFLLTFYHATDRNKPIGGPINFGVSGEPRVVDPRVMQRADWSGPRTLVFPTQEERRTDVPLARMPGTFTEGTAAQSDLGGREGAGRSIEVDRAHEARRRAEDELHRRELALAEEKRRMDLDSLKREYESRLREAQMRPAEKSSDPVTPAITALAPVLAEMIKSSNEGRMQMARAQMEAQARQTELLMALLNRKPEPTPDPLSHPVVVELLRAQQDGGGNKIISSMAEAMGAMTQTTMQFMHTMAEMQTIGQPEAEPMWLKAFREGMSAFTKMAASSARAIPPAQPRPPQLPPQQQPPSPRPPNGATAAQRPVAPPAPPAPPAPEPPRPVQFEGYDPTTAGQYQRPVEETPSEESTPSEGESTAPVVQALIDAIMRKDDPTVVAQSFIDALDEDDMKTELLKHEGDPEKLFAAHLTAWVIADGANVTYVDVLGKEVQRLGIEAGIFGEDEDGEEVEEKPVAQGAAA